MNLIEQQFFNELEKKLWTAADKLRSSLDASVYIGQCAPYRR
jgi:type I restriction enzyme M protein